MNMIGQKIAVKITKKYNDEVEFSTGKLYLDVTWSPEQHVTICGSVVALPRGKWCKNTRGQFLKQELQTGDLVYFNYLTVQEDNLVFGEKDIYLVDLEECFCFLRGGSLTAISNHVLIEPLMIEEMVGSIYIGVPTRSEEEGNLIHIGTPIKDFEDLGLISGDMVRFHERNAFLNTIEGTDYYVMKQDDIFGKILNGGNIQHT
jgi:co-chaperonin GroES (HSP10)